MTAVDENSKDASASDGKPAPEAPIAVVGVGVGAASLRSLEQLFAGVTPQIGASYLIAVRQQEGLDVATVTAVLERQSQFAVTIAADGERIVPNRIYVGGPDDLIAIVDGHLRIRPAAEPVAHRGTIDSLFISLAEQAHEKAVAVILAGLATDGSAGLTATKKFGGLSIAEVTPEGHEDAPGTAAPAPVADLHLPIDKIAPAIALYASSLAPLTEPEDKDEVAQEIEAHITQITTILRNVTSHDFHGYKRGTFVRRIQRRLQVLQIASVEAYVARLRSDRDEVQSLFQDLLIGVTQFFRDPAEFEALERELPRLFENTTAGDPLRVWVLGCATGEEAYSIAILLRERMATLDRPPDVQIFATDLDGRALSLARAGRYAANAIVSHVRPERLERWFVREGDTFCVSKELREMCIFSPHNIVKDAPFSRIDILSCRNLLIYLNTDLQNRVIPIFHFSLRTGGVLFLGSSENITRHQKLFAPVDRKTRVFRRLETATRVIPDFPLTSRPRPQALQDQSLAPAPASGRLSGPISRRAEAIAERYAPAYVVVDVQGDVLHFSGRTGRYLEPAAGVASLNLLSLVNRDLRLDLRSALARAVAEGRPIELPRLQLTREDRTYAVNVVIEPVETGDVTSLVVVFQDGGVVDDGPADGDRLVTDEQVQRLEAELRLTRDRLQATIEELETTNEELKSSNEEYQSINEELQSASEEMETSKEELQSVNEELHTVNGELGHRVAELAASNSDIKNLLESTQIATVFLDNGLRIRNFTPAATDIFHLLETDAGRPLHHIASRLNYPELADDVRRVLKTLAPVERSVVDPSADRHYAARVLPYRSVDNYIGGAVVTFTDMTAVRRAEAALRAIEDRHRNELERQVEERTAELKQSRDLVQATMDASMDMIQVFEAVRDGGGEIVDFRWLLNNHAAELQLGDVVGERLLDHNPGVGAEGIFETFKEVVTTGHPRRDERHYVHEQFDGWFHQSVVKLGDGVATTTMEVTERRMAEAEILRLGNEVAQARLRESEERYRILVEAIDDGFCVIEVLFDAQDNAVDYRFLEVNPAFEAQSGLVGAVGRTIRDLVPGHESRWFGVYGRVAVTGDPVRFEDPAAALGRWHDVYAVRVGQPEDRRVALLFRDIQERKRAEMALRESETRARRLVEGIAQATWEADPEGLMRADSPSWREHTGQSYEDWIGQGWLDAVHADDRASLEGQWRAAIAGKGDVDADIRLARAGSDIWRWINMRAVPLLNDDGTVQKWVGMNIDIDERMRATEAVRVSEERFRAVASAGAYMMYRMSPDWRLMYQLSGRDILADAVEPLESWTDAYLLSEDRPAITAAIEEAVRATSMFDLEHRVRRADEAIGWVHSRAVPILGSDGEVVEWVGTGIEITRRRAAEDALRASEERQAFLLKLSDALRPLGEPDAIQLAAAQVLGRRLGASRVAYAENDEEGRSYVVSRSYGDGMPELVGRYRYEDHGADVRARLQAGQTRVLSDVAGDASLSDAEREALTTLGIAAVLDVPLVKGGTLVAFLDVTYTTAHVFQPDEVELVTEVAERTWAAVVRVRAEAALRDSEERFRQFGEASQDVLWIRDAETFQWTYLTPAFELIYGLDRASALRGDNMAGWVDLIVPEDRERAVANIERVREGEWVTFEYRVRRPQDGEIRWLRNTDFPIKDVAGRVVRIGGIGHDVTALKLAAEALVAAEQRQRALLEGIPQLVWRAIENGDWTWASPQWTNSTGQSNLESQGQGWMACLHPDDREMARTAWRTARETGGFEVECRIRGDDPERYRWFQMRATPLRDDRTGTIVEWLGTSTDVHDLRQLQDEQKVMVAELQHRTRNLMGVVRSVAETTLRSSGSLDEFGPKFRDRIAALARVQGLLSRLTEGDRVTFDDLIRAELSAVGGLDGVADRIALDGPTGVALRSSTVQTFALALHELATNAVKYGALGQTQGRLAIRWHLEPSGEGRLPWLHVDWRESGVAMPPVDAAPQGGGSGRMLIERALPYQLGAKTTYVMAADGVSCTISLPVSDHAVPKTANVE